MVTNYSSRLVENGRNTLHVKLCGAGRHRPCCNFLG